jgi:hypothetical protein
MTEFEVLVRKYDLTLRFDANAKAFKHTCGW